MSDEVVWDIPVEQIEVCPEPYSYPPRAFLIVPDKSVIGLAQAADPDAKTRRVQVYGKKLDGFDFLVRIKP